MAKKPRLPSTRRPSRGKPPHTGSYATAELAQTYNVVVPEVTVPDNLIKKKVAMSIGYIGTNYSGFQMNAGVKTVQSEVELALYKTNLILPTNFGLPVKYAWSVSGRTDKGVHATAQTVSLKVEMPADSHATEPLIARINANLPSDIRILDMVKTTKNFCAKTQRDRVRYQYMIPSFVFEDRNVLRELFCSTVNYPGNGCSIDSPVAPSEMIRIVPALINYRISEEQHTFLHEVLQDYVGTHSFHNFAKRVSATEARAARYVSSVEVEDPVIYESGLEWIPVTITGQSFLLNQIRKMMSVAVDVVRGQAPRNMISLAYARERDNLRFSLAPAQGLFLDMSYYESYNEHKKGDGLPALGLNEATNVAYRQMRQDVLNHIMNEETSQWNFVQHMFHQEFIFDHKRFYADIAESTTMSD